jgi:hypothetical protein
MDAEVAEEQVEPLGRQGEGARPLEHPLQVTEAHVPLALPVCLDQTLPPRPTDGGSGDDENVLGNDENISLVVVTRG